MNVKSRKNCKVDERGRLLNEASISVSVELLLPVSDYDSCMSDWERFKTIYDDHLFNDLVSMFSSLGFVVNAEEDIDVRCSLNTSSYC